MKRHVLRVLKVLLGIVVVVVFVLGGYILYLQLNYYRIPDNITVANEGASPLAAPVEIGKEYTASTYNIGFGAYTPDYTFFMDEGIMADGTRTKGEHGRAISKDSVEKCTEGALTTISTLNNGKQPDFMLFQEVDRNSDRSYHVDQSATIKSKFPENASYFAQNFHTGFLAYPIPEFHGSVDSGLMTLSGIAAQESVRRSYPVDQSFFAKFFDLDRCFMITRYPTDDGHELVLINSHMSAYDAGGTMRAKQLAMLRDILVEERAKGNYVIAGGDWNHALAGSLTLYSSDQQVPDWVAELKDSDLPEGFSVVKADNLAAVPSCRGDDIPYVKGHTYTTTVDGWIVSDNVKARAENVDTGFAYSDHNPVLLRFTLGASE